MTTKGYIFDYGGTLDTGGCHWGKLIGHCYEQCGVPVADALFREAYVYAERELGRNPIIQPDYSFHKTLEVKLRIEMEYIERQLPDIHVFDWYQKVLDLLYQHTQDETAKSRQVVARLAESYPLVLVSNFYGNMHHVLREFGFDGLFREVVESAVVGVRKPDPRIFTLGVEALGMEAAEETVVGDSYDKDIVPASKAGCQTVWLKGEGWTDEQPDGEAAGRIITDIRQLLQ